jgi:hypothetical protein
MRLSGGQYVALFFMAQPPAQTVTMQALGWSVVVQLIAVGALCSFLIYRRVSLGEVIGWRRLSFPKVLGYSLLFLVSVLPLLLLVSSVERHFWPHEPEQPLVTYVREQAKQGQLGPTLAVGLLRRLSGASGRGVLLSGFFYGSIKRFFGPHRRCPFHGGALLSHARQCARSGAALHPGHGPSMSPTSGLVPCSSLSPCICCSIAPASGS